MYSDAITLKNALQCIISKAYSTAVYHTVTLIYESQIDLNKEICYSSFDMCMCFSVSNPIYHIELDLKQSTKKLDQTNSVILCLQDRPSQ